MLYNIDSVNKYINDTKDKIIDTYRPTYHMCTNVGWMNDPNGLIYKDGLYHLYYQANPYGVEPGKMLWGHFVSKDLISYKDVGIALCPEGKGENAFSGGAIEINNDIHIYYTLHTNKIEDVVRISGQDKNLLVEHSLSEEINELHKHDERIKEDESMKAEEVYHSVSHDGNYFKKGVKVFDNNTLPKELSRIDFRDPSPYKYKDNYYLFLGARNEELDQGVIVVLKGKDLDHFEYDFQIGPFYELGFMGECPCLRRVGNKDVFVVSGCGVKRKDNSFKNMNSSCFIVGNIDFENKTMKVDYLREIDKGDSFYAPQFISGTKEAVMVSWLEMWEKHYVTKRLGHGWVGCFTIPRVLKEVDGQIYQTIIPTLYDHLKDCEGSYVPKSAYLSFDLANNSRIILKGENGQVIIGNSAGGVYLDNTNANSLYKCIRRTDCVYKKARIKVLLDVSGLEVFVNNGLETISTRIYIDGKLNIKQEGKVTNLIIKEVVPNL